MILSIDSNDANTAPLHKKTISSLSGAVESMMKKLEDVGVLVARILMPILFIYSAAIFLIPICISFDTAEKRRYATYLILNRRFSFGF